MGFMTCLKLDIDNYLSITRIFEVNSIYTSCSDNELINLRVFKTNHGYHVYLWYRNKIPDHEIIMLQMAMGSDFRRELFNMIRIRKWNSQSNWNVLFTRKYKFHRSGMELISCENPDERKENLLKRIIGLEYDTDNN